MKYLIKTWFGVFVANDSNEIVDKRLYPKNVEGLVSKNLRKENEEVEEIKDTYSNLSLSAPVSIERKIKEEVWDEYIGKYEAFINDVSFKISQKKIEEGLKKRGEHIIRLVKILDVLDKSLNNIESITEELYDYDLSCNQDNLSNISNSVGSATGKTKNEKDLVLLNLVQDIKELSNTEDLVKLEIRDRMESFATNISKTAGGILGARLISEAGGLKKLAMMPSGTIQVLGAEKALFRHLREGSAPPKHGIIFQNPLIRNSHWSKRGKISRSLSAVIAMAARIDYFSGKDKSKYLQKKLEKRMREIKNE